MILMFGSAGAGKSLQGQILAARYGWSWISVGKLLRERADWEIQTTLKHGDLLPLAITERIVDDRLDEEKDLSRVVLDGFPRSIEQAEALTKYAMRRQGNAGVEAIIVLDLGRDEVVKRLLARGRSDDTEEAIAKRLDIFTTEGEEILQYYDDLGVRIERVPANRTVGQVYDNIEQIIESLQV